MKTCLAGLVTVYTKPVSVMHGTYSLVIYTTGRWLGEPEQISFWSINLI